jgi:hypothetical protein
VLRVPFRRTSGWSWSLTGVRKSLLARAILLGIGALLLSSCASSTQASGENAGRLDHAPSGPGESAGLVLPLDAYVFDLDVLTLIHDAHHKLVDKCMSGLGFQYKGAWGGGMRSGFNRYGIVDARQAERHGYQDPRGPLGGMELLGEAPEGYFAALLGEDAPSGHGASGSGCDGAAVRSLSVPGMERLDLEIPNRLIRQALELSQSDPRWHTADKAWANCMRGRGFAFQTPEAAIGSSWPQPVGTEERAAAVADVQCKTETHLVEARFAVESEHQEALLEAQSAVLAEIKMINEQRINRALEVLRTVGQ